MSTTETFIWQATAQLDGGSFIDSTTTNDPPNVKQELGKTGPVHNLGSIQNVQTGPKERPRTCSSFCKMTQADYPEEN